MSMCMDCKKTGAKLKGTCEICVERSYRRALWAIVDQAKRLHYGTSLKKYLITDLKIITDLAIDALGSES